MAAKLQRLTKRQKIGIVGVIFFVGLVAIWRGAFDSPQKREEKSPKRDEKADVSPQKRDEKMGFDDFDFLIPIEKERAEKELVAALKYVLVAKKKSNTDIAFMHHAWFTEVADEYKKEYGLTKEQARELSERAGVDVEKRAHRGTDGEWDEECWYLSYWLQVFEGVMEAIQIEGGNSC